MTEENFSKKTKQIFHQTSGTQKLPENLESNVVARLQQENLITKNKKIRSIQYLKYAGAIAASILIFMSGIYYEKMNTPQDFTIDNPNGYLVLLHEDEQFQPTDVEQMFEEYEQWTISTFNKGVNITGNELKSESVFITNETRPPFDKSSLKTTGYFLLEAKTLEQAMQIAEEIPHVKYEGIVELKTFMVR